jgi:hypothetical protein
MVFKWPRNWAYRQSRAHPDIAFAMVSWFTITLVQEPPETFFNAEDFVPELREIFSHPPLGPRKTVLVAISVKDPSVTGGRVVPQDGDRGRMSFTDGKEFWHWEVESLRSLFRGDRQPPVLGDYPEAYNDSFLLLDLHALEVSKFLGDRRDAEMKEIYSMLRRRPDGRSLGFVHDHMWRAAALVLGTRPLSQAEFEAIMARLERSCRTFEQGPVSRNYVATLRNTIGRATGHGESD